MAAPSFLGLRFRLAGRLDPFWINIAENNEESFITDATLKSLGESTNDSVFIKAPAGSTLLIDGQLRFKKGEQNVSLWISPCLRIIVKFCVIHGGLEVPTLGVSWLRDYGANIRYSRALGRRVSFCAMNHHGEHVFIFVIYICLKNMSVMCLI